MSDLFLEMLAESDREDLRQAQVLLDTNVVLEILTVGDLLREGDKFASTETAAASASYEYRLKRSRPSTLLAWTLATRGIAAGCSATRSST